METIKINKGNTLLVAHRGLCSFEKENTMASFIAAGNHSYYGIECDIHPTLDGKLVIIHDSDTKRVSGISKIVENTLYEDLNRINLYDIECKNNYDYLKIPLFSDYLDCCIRYNKKCIIEFKEIFTKENIIKTIEMVKDKNYLDNCIFISFYDTNLLLARQLYKEINCQWLVSAFSKENLENCRKNKFDIDIEYHSLTKEIISLLHENNIKVNAWTVNDKFDGEKLVEYGIDYITTNCLE